MDKPEVIGRSYHAKALLFQVDREKSRATNQGDLVIVVPGLVRILRAGTDTVIGYASVVQEGQATVARLYLDYSTPERLELQNGEKRYLRAFRAPASVFPETFVLTHLSLSDQPSSTADVPVGSPETVLC
jgi:hypothetical protein